MENQKLTKKERYELKKQDKHEILQKLEKQRKARRFLFWGGGRLILAVAVWGVSKWAVNTAPDYTDKSVDVVTDTDWIKGNPESKVTLLEYADFQCPACQTYYFFVKQLEEEFGDKIKIVFRHLPLRSIHARAQLAGQAAEAAGLQGKFWEMHNVLFEKQSEWTTGNHEDLFVNYAREMGLDVEQFKIDLESQPVQDKVDSGYLNAVNAGLTSTPSFFINGKKISNPRDYNTFKNLINEALQTT